VVRGSKRFFVLHEGLNRGRTDLHFLFFGNCSLQGICLTAQLVDAVPLSPHDRMLDFIVTPDETIESAL
jgi:5-formyltetrahydrofolate cyclo-ligase